MKIGEQTYPYDEDRNNKREVSYFKFKSLYHN